MCDSLQWSSSLEYEYLSSSSSISSSHDILSGYFHEGLLTGPTLDNKSATVVWTSLMSCFKLSRQAWLPRRWAIVASKLIYTQRHKVAFNQNNASLNRSIEFLNFLNELPETSDFQVLVSGQSTDFHKQKVERFQSHQICTKNLEPSKKKSNEFLTSTSGLSFQRPGLSLKLSTSINVKCNSVKSQVKLLFWKIKKIQIFQFKGRHVCFGYWNCTMMQHSERKNA